MTHICVGNLTIIGLDNGLSPGRRQAIIWTSAGILLIRPLGTNFNEIAIEIHAFSFNKMHLKMSSAKWCPFCLGLNVLRPIYTTSEISVWASESELGRNQNKWINVLCLHWSESASKIFVVRHFKSALEMGQNLMSDQHDMLPLDQAGGRIKIVMEPPAATTRIIPTTSV